jgi:hypothetical protein
MKGRIAPNKGKFEYVEIIRTDLATGEEVKFANKQSAAESVDVSVSRINQSLSNVYPVINKKYKFTNYKDK